MCPWAGKIHTDRLTCLDSYPDVLDMQLSYLYDNGLISQVVPEMQRKLNDAVGAGMPQAVNVIGAMLIRFSALLVKQQTPQWASPPPPAGVYVVMDSPPVEAPRAVYEDHGTFPLAAR